LDDLDRQIRRPRPAPAPVAPGATPPRKFRPVLAVAAAVVAVGRLVTWITHPDGFDGLLTSSFTVQPKPVVEIYFNAPAALPSGVARGHTLTLTIVVAPSDLTKTEHAAIRTTVQTGSTSTQATRSFGLFHQPRTETFQVPVPANCASLQFEAVLVPGHDHLSYAAPCGP
jgi:hypothetical protein